MVNPKTVALLRGNESCPRGDGGGEEPPPRFFANCTISPLINSEYKQVPKQVKWPHLGLRIFLQQPLKILTRLREILKPITSKFVSEENKFLKSNQ